MAASILSAADHSHAPPASIWPSLQSAGLAAAMVAILAPFSPEPLGVSVQFAAWLLVACCAYPGLRWLRGARNTVPAFEAICAAYCAQFAVPALLLPNQFASTTGVVLFSDGELAQALLLATLGVMCLIAGYDLLLRSRFAAALPQLAIPLDHGRLGPYLIVAVLAGSLLSVARSTGRIPPVMAQWDALLGLLSRQMLVAIGILAYLVFQGQSRGRVYPLLLAVASAAAFLAGLSGGMLENAFVVLAILLMVRLHVRGSIPWVMVLVLTAAYLVLQPVKAQFRDRAYYGDEAATLTATQKLGLWFDLTTSAVPDLVGTDGIKGVVDRQAGSLHRLDLVHTLADVRGLTPAVLPYYGGDTYRYMLVGWIPRVVWPQKPEALEANTRLILDYGVLPEAQLDTTVMSLGTVAEAYVNFGIGGIVVIMLVQGLILGACARVFGSNGDIGAAAVLLSQMVYFLNGIGGTTVMLYGALLQGLLANAFILWLVVGARKPNRPPTDREPIFSPTRFRHRCL